MPDMQNSEGPGPLGKQIPTLEELEALHRSLNHAEREELLECLLIAASGGPECVMRALSPWLLAAAARQLVERPEGWDD